jgi:hypothetical protein
MPSLYDSELRPPCLPFIGVDDLRCDEFPESEAVDAIDIATDILWILTGRQFGVCSSTVTPSAGAQCHTSVDLFIGLWPIVSVEEVRVNGVPVNGDSYRVSEGRRSLVRTDDGWWSATDSIEADLTWGILPPILVKKAVARMACEFLNMWNSKPCGLPETVTSVVRPGVTMQALPKEEDLSKGLVGIYEVNMAIRLYNPSGLQSPSMIWSPDLVNRR